MKLCDDVMCHMSLHVDHCIFVYDLTQQYLECEHSYDGHCCHITNYSWVLIDDVLLELQCLAFQFCQCCSGVDTCWIDFTSQLTLHVYKR